MTIRNIHTPYSVGSRLSSGGSANGSFASSVGSSGFFLAMSVSDLRVDMVTDTLRYGYDNRFIPIAQHLNRILARLQPLDKQSTATVGKELYFQRRIFYIYKVPYVSFNWFTSEFTNVA